MEQDGNDMLEVLRSIQYRQNGSTTCMYSHIEEDNGHDITAPHYLKVTAFWVLRCLVAVTYTRVHVSIEDRHLTLDHNPRKS